MENGKESKDYLQKLSDKLHAYAERHEGHPLGADVYCGPITLSQLVNLVDSALLYRTHYHSTLEAYAKLAEKDADDQADHIVIRDDSDVVNEPAHYKQGGLEVFDIIESKLTPEEVSGFYKGNILKYTFRAPHKGAEIEDHRKAGVYNARLVAWKEKQEC